MHSRSTRLLFIIAGFALAITMGAMVTWAFLRHGIHGIAVGEEGVRLTMASPAVSILACPEAGDVILDLHTGGSLVRVVVPVGAALEVLR